MSDSIAQIIERVGAGQLYRGEVVTCTESDRLVVNLDGDEPDQVTCDVLVTTDVAPLKIGAGDQVLAWIPAGRGNAVVIGRIDGGRNPAAKPEHLPGIVTIEAKHTLTLRVGDGSITIREDGKILIKGKDLVSHAKRVNRIRGGSVQIN